MGFRVSLHGSNPEPPMSALGQKQTLQSVRPMSALPPKADINHRERDVGFVPFCSVDNLARNTEGAHGRSSPKSLICRPAASDRLHKKSIFCTKSSPLVARDRVRGHPADLSGL